MIRYATISSVNCCRSLRTISTTNHVFKSKTQIIPTSIKYLLLACYEGSRIVTVAVPAKKTAKAVLRSVTPETTVQLVEPVTTNLASVAKSIHAKIKLCLGYVGRPAQHYLEYLHRDAGLPWWGAILAGTVLIHLLLFPLRIKQQRTATNIHIFKPQVNDLQLKITEATKNGNAMMAAKYTNDLKVFMKEKDINPTTQNYRRLYQVPFFTSIIVGLREMVNRPVESMKTEGILWFPDLTIADPFHVFPFIACTTFFIGQMISREMPTGIWGRIKKYALRAFPFIAFFFTLNVSAGLHFYFSIMNAMTLSQLLLLSHPKVRSRLNIPNVVKHTQSLYWKNTKLTREKEEQERKRALRAPIPKTYSYDPTKVSPPRTAIQTKSK